MDTELKLLHWRDGQTKAERLCAGILLLESFSGVDPQCPLGGPDGIKDVICEKNNWKYIGAAYFAVSEKTFIDIKKKFEGDLLGVNKNDVDGIIFLTNQKLSPGERKTLITLAEAKDAKAIIYHRERIRVILDNPQGFAHRLEYLGIDMSREEQLSFFSQWDNIFSQKLQEQSEYIITSISKKMEILVGRSSEIIEDIGSMVMSTMSTVSSLAATAQHSAKSGFFIPEGYYATKNLTSSMLCTFHNAICYEHVNATEMGKFRTAQVWIGSVQSSQFDAIYTPPAPELVQGLIDELLEDWRSNYLQLEKSNDKNEIIEKITNFHHGFVKIHPFLDGNGRLARYLLMLQASELLGIERWVTLEDKKVYFNALNDADNGNLESLQRVITQAIYGVEESDG